jgi:tetratricopeptide (TPR) repeat protein
LCASASQDADYRQEGFVGACTTWFLGTPDNQEKALALTQRAIAFDLQDREHQALLDREIAVALDPDNPFTHGNLGFALLNEHNSRAALQEFDKALSLRETPQRAWYYAGRAQAMYNLHDEAGALADAQKSVELHQNTLAEKVLADLNHDRGDNKGAK